MIEPDYPATGKSWSPRETKLLKELWPKATLDEMSKVFKRKTNAIRQKGSEQGLPGKGTTIPDMIDEEFLAELRKQKEIEV